MIAFDFGLTDGLKGLRIEFLCPKCHAHIEEFVEDIPFPNYEADNNSESLNSDGGGICCCDCGAEFSYEINCGMYSGGEFLAKDIPNDAKISEVTSQ